ncbi:Hypothetical protein PHPALM_3274 [Phytophthora palmivora]|uniref:Uncharacterized protein n=1 Tax=Phytophthora palmivora TaxID=4796 RepID=A0A2P4YMY7_9STRA|nr:Hypothetical protein PHPALM_3274 [Phytophthora palmivora]
MTVHQSSDYSLSSVAVGSLARLTPVGLMPERYSRHMMILTKLKQIRQVQVSRGTANKRSYVIDVFTTSQSITRIPTSLNPIDSTLTEARGQQSTKLFSRPDIHVEKQFTDFVKLRDELYDACHTGPHLYMNCRFCSEVTRYLLFGAVLPGALLTWMLSQHQRSKAVQRFIESLLQLAVSCPVIDSEACICQEKLPRKLYNFLFQAKFLQRKHSLLKFLSIGPSIETMASALQQTSTNIVVGGLAKLIPMNLMPERYSKHMQTVTKLKQIHSVSVSFVNGCYAIDVYTPSHSTSRIPTSFKIAATGQQPDVHIEKKFTDFVNLRDEIYETCKRSHPDVCCSFCSDVGRTLLLGAVLPGVMLILVLSQRQQTKAVQRFIDSLLRLAAMCPVIDSDACPCQKQLPLELVQFLFGESDPLA